MNDARLFARTILNYFCCVGLGTSLLIKTLAGSAATKHFSMSFGLVGQPLTCRTTTKRHGFNMNEQYSEYLNSEAWQKKRMQRLSISKFQCSACGTKTDIQVHHLTYARIFDEDMEDLLPLCRLHHEAAEEMVRLGKLPRSDDVLFLATETIRLITSKKTEPPNARPNQFPDSFTSYKMNVNGNQVTVRTQWQESLLKLDWFVKVMMEDRDALKRAIRKAFPYRHRNIASSNAIALWRRFGGIRNAAKRALREQLNKSGLDPWAPSQLKPVNDIPPAITKSPFADALLAQPWFIQALTAPTRKDFRRLIHPPLKHVQHRQQLFLAAYGLYDNKFSNKARNENDNDMV